MKYDVLLVLAAGLTDEGTLPTSAKKRVEKAVSFFKAGRSSALLMSGKHSKYWMGRSPKKTEACAMAEYAQRLGVLETAIHKEELSHDTFGNIFWSKKLFFDQRKWSKIGIITSDFHVLRTKLICKKLLNSSYKIDFFWVKTDENFLKSMVRKVFEYFKIRSL